MTQVFGGFVFQASAVTLLLLALSPLTAPFSTWHLSDVFAATGTGIVAVVESKVAADHKVTVPSLGPERLTRVAPAQVVRPLRPADRAAGLLHIPLRL